MHQPSHYLRLFSTIVCNFAGISGNSTFVKPSANISAYPLSLSKIDPLNQRFTSLDVFRGYSVPDDTGQQSWLLVIHLSATEHAWHGCSPHRSLFFLFPFAVGMRSLLLICLNRQVPRRSSTHKRTLLIFAIGLFLNWAPFIGWDGELLKSKPWEYANSQYQLPASVLPSVTAHCTELLFCSIDRLFL